MTPQRLTYPLAIAGLSLVGALAGCSASGDAHAPAAADPGNETNDTSETNETNGTYADGSYSASADYRTPSTTETLDVTVTLDGGIISDVEVVGHGTNPNSKRYQGEFIGGIADVVVGKSIDEISVDKVAGSSLSSGGFNDAIEQIKAEAAR